MRAANVSGGPTGPLVSLCSGRQSAAASLRLLSDDQVLQKQPQISLNVKADPSLLRDVSGRGSCACSGRLETKKKKPLDALCNGLQLLHLPLERSDPISISISSASRVSPINVGFTASDAKAPRSPKLACERSR